LRKINFSLIIRTVRPQSACEYFTITKKNSIITRYLCTNPKSRNRSIGLPSVRITCIQHYICVYILSQISCKVPPPVIWYRGAYRSSIHYYDVFTLRTVKSNNYWASHRRSTKLILYFGVAPRLLVLCRTENGLRQIYTHLL